MTDKFEFQWKAEDKFYRDGDTVNKWRVAQDQERDSDLVFAYSYDLTYTISTSSQIIKPRGKKTKARYKAEKLKWQQSRIKVGDWVIDFLSSSNPQAFEVKGVDTIQGFENGLAASEFRLISNEDGGKFPAEHLKPCRPPVSKDEDFKWAHAEALSLGSKCSGWFTHNDRRQFRLINHAISLNDDVLGNVRNSTYLELMSNQGLIPVDSSDLRQIADLLDGIKNET